jgi:predicted PurR-regulated permease PerM
MNSSSSKLQHHFFLFLFVIAAGAMFFIWRPFLAPLVLAGSFAIVFQPLYIRINKRLKNHSSIASLLTVLIILIVILVPLVLIGGLLFNEARDLYLQITNNSGQIAHLNAKLALYQRHIHAFAPDINLNLTKNIQLGLGWVLAHLDTFFSGFLSILLGAVVMTTALFFFLRDGRMFRDQLFILSPLNTKYDKNIFSKIIATINSVIRGSIVVSAAQGIFATIGFAIAGIPNPIIWGVAAMFTSLIPGVGTSLITIPCIIFLFVTAPAWHGVILIIWAIIGIALIDNFLSPFILRRGIKIHQFLILISVLGGIAFFGPIGFIMGPIMLAFFFALLELYPTIIRSES